MVMLPVPTVLIFPAVGEIAPPEFPVRVSRIVVPLVVTNPFASTENLAESNAASPTFVASVDAIAWDFCTLTVKVLTAPAVETGDEPAAVEAPSIFQFPAVGAKAPPELPVIVFPTVVPPATDKAKELAPVVNVIELSGDVRVPK